ncbi:phosphate:acyl-[acyl carrier protein] acyltransferase [Propionispira arboris]|uniref:Phosphate acyltransferase n=1 Tax=Propionispira arboris TaxID=84035 RepID=A0A1H6VT03_9FIRM|nr:phosphate acyltransferase PlsX [Propionispira arboris]SEJ07753.1 phosphate:acyl-[acyl carrier protein] acyltransferase [Propionispira arboris]
MKIAVDAMGGDFAPEQIVLGAIAAAKQYDCEVVLVGDENKVKAELNKSPHWQDLKISIYHASDEIGMAEHPGAAVRRKKDASIVVATRLVKDGTCDAVLSAGSTGAAVASALFGLGRIKGIDRPTIATPMPTVNGVTLLLDSGANIDSKPQHLVQSALMGSIYAEYVFGIKSPRVGLLNIGEESTKGNEQALATYPLLQEMKTINFQGNAEGRDIPRGTFDVVVCDGFVGNVVLKFAEGLAKTIMKLIKETIKGGGWLAKAGAVLLVPTFKKLAKKMDYAEYGGAPLLGVNGCYIICHGSSNAKAIRSAIGVANEYVKNNVLEHISDSIAKEEILNNDSDGK